MIIWSGSWTSGKLIANTTSPQITLFWRYFISAVGLACFLVVSGESFRLRLKQALWVLLGSIIMTFYTYIFLVGLKTGYAGAAGVLVTSMNPIFTFFLMRAVFNHKLTRRDGFGLLLGAVGGVVLLEAWNLHQESVLLSGNLLFLFAALVYACVTLTTNSATKRMSIAVYSFYLNAMGAVLVLPWVGFGIVNTPPTANHEYWFNIVYLGLISNAFATTVYFYAVSKLGSARASSYIFIVPATALLIAAVYLREPVKLTTVTGGLIALIAVSMLRGSTRRDAD